MSAEFDTPPEIANPWLTLPTKAPYIAPGDEAALQRLAAKIERKGADEVYKYGFQTQLLPDPWTGNPLTAPILVLTANPGFTDDARASAWAHLGCKGSDEWWHLNSVVMRESYRANLTHDAQEYPLFFLRPELAASPGGCYYRFKQFKQLIERYGAKRIANAFCIVEFAPYHSREFRDFGPIPSQAYTFQLIRRAIARKATIVLLRGPRLFLDYPYMRPSSVRSPAISSGNIGGFESLCRAIEASG